VVAVDAKRVGAPGEPARWQVFTHGGRTNEGLDVITWCVRIQALGAGEILLTSMDRDGTKDGYDVELTRAVVDAVTIPVIASGGVGTLEHIRDGLLRSGADAALAASIFHDGTYTVAQVKDFLGEAHVRVRPPTQKQREVAHRASGA
jgi:imidazole glycerol-phosphate synthase subunit HisF